MIFFNIGANFLTNTIGFAIPAYYSLEALFTTKTSDDSQVSLSPSPRVSTRYLA